VTFVAGALSELIRVPRNVIIQKGDNVSMECGSDFMNFNLITWTYDGITAASAPCTSADPTRFTAVQPALEGQNCFLTALGTATVGNQGVYQCSDGRGKDAQAVALLIGTGCSCESFFINLSLNEFILLTAHYSLHCPAIGLS